MSRPPQASDFAGARIVWLLELDWGGQVYRLATEAIVVDKEDGTSLPYAGGLSQPDLREKLGRLSTDPGEKSVSVEAHLPVNVAALRRQGHDILTARGTLAFVTVKGSTVGQTWEGRFREFDGVVRSAQYADPTKPAGWLAFQLKEEPWQDRSTIIPPAARISETSWSAAHESHIGKVYPTVIGSPGIYTDIDGAEQMVSGSPAYIIDWNVAATPVADKLLIAGHIVESGSVQVYDGTNWQSFTVEHEADALGRTCAVVDTSTPGSLDTEQTEYWVAWDTGGGLHNPFGPGALELIGDVLHWAMLISSLDVDHGRARVAADRLRWGKIGTYINDPEVSAWDWAVDYVLELAQVTIRRTADGLWPQVWDQGTAARAVISIAEGSEFRQAGHVQQEREIDDLVNSLVVEYAIDASGSDAKRVVTLVADPDTDDPEQATSLYTQVSAGRYGTTSDATDLPQVWDSATAQRVALDAARADAFGVETLSYIAAPSWGWLQVGDPVEMTSETTSGRSTARYDSQQATVDERRWLGESWGFVLLIDDDIVRDGRATP